MKELVICKNASKCKYTGCDHARPHRKSPVNCNMLCSIRYGITGSTCREATLPEITVFRMLNGEIK